MKSNDRLKASFVLNSYHYSNLFNNFYFTLDTGILTRIFKQQIGIFMGSEICTDIICTNTICTNIICINTNGWSLKFGPCFRKPNF